MANPLQVVSNIFLYLEFLYFLGDKLSFNHYCSPPLALLALSVFCECVFACLLLFFIFALSSFFPSSFSSVTTISTCDLFALTLLFLPYLHGVLALFAAIWKITRSFVLKPLTCAFASTALSIFKISDDALLG